MKTKRLIAVSVVLVVLTYAGSAQALTLLEDRLRFDGYVKTQFGVWLQDQTRYGMGGNSINMIRGTLQLETQVNVTKWAQLYTIFRGVKETSYEAERGVPDDFYDEADLRELYLDLDIGEQFHLRIGRQQVVWGEADYQRILDIINPIDMSWHFLLEPWEDIRIPNYMIRAFYRVPSFLKSSFEVIWIPGWDDSENRVNKNPPLPPAAGRWTPHPTNLIVPSIPGIRTNYVFNYPSRNVQDSNVGARWEAMIGDFQFALAYYYTFNYDPLPVPRPLSLPTDIGSIIKIITSGGIDTYIDMLYPRVHISGASCNYYWDLIGTVIRGEFAYYWGQPYSALEWQEVELVPGIKMLSPNLFIEKSDTIKYMIGLDRPTMIRWLNKYSALTFTGQFIQTILLDHMDNMVAPGGYATPIDKVQTYINFGVTTNYWHGQLWITEGGAYDVSGGWIYQNALEFKPTDNLRFNFKTNCFWAHSDYDGFGLVRDKKEAIVELVYQW